MKITKGSVLSIIVIILIIVFTGGVIAETISSTSNVVFDVFLPNATCIIDGTESYWKEPGNLAESSKDNCFKADGINQQGYERTECCPISYKCVDDNCVYDDASGDNPTNVASCKDYSESREDCERDAYHREAAINDLDSIIDLTTFPGGCEEYHESYGREVDPLCYSSIRCECRWNATIEECGAKINRLVEKYVRPPYEWWDWSDRKDADKVCDATSIIRVTGGCTFHPTIKNDCSEGDDFLIRTWTAVYENEIENSDCTEDLKCQNHPDLGSDFYCNPEGICAGDYCKTRDEIIPCDKVARLPFFSLQNIIIAIILLVIIYYFILKKKKK